MDFSEQTPQTLYSVLSQFEPLGPIKTNKTKSCSVKMHVGIAVGGGPTG